MSGYVGDAVARQARDAGAEEVLLKPLSAVTCDQPRASAARLSGVLGMPS